MLGDASDSRRAPSSNTGSSRSLPDPSNDSPSQIFPVRSLLANCFAVYAARLSIILWRTVKLKQNKKNSKINYIKLMMIVRTKKNKIQNSSDISRARVSVVLFHCTVSLRPLRNLAVAVVGFDSGARGFNGLDRSEGEARPIT